MRWSEHATIYLAAGASFGVSRYLSANARKSRVRAVMEGFAAMFLWPMTCAAILIRRARLLPEEDAAAETEALLHRRIDDARRAFIVAVNFMLDAVRRSRALKRDERERVLYALREGVEQYAGLAEIREHLDEEARPAKHEMELARISGRRGKDLLVAGRCAHRRNVSRIRAHYERERSRLLRKLAELQDFEDADTASARLEIYMRAATLFSLLEDDEATREVTHLANAERARLRRASENNQARTSGEETCTENANPLSYKGPLRSTMFTQG